MDGYDRSNPYGEPQLVAAMAVFRKLGVLCQAETAEPIPAPFVALLEDLDGIEAVKQDHLSTPRELP